jgi:hypothetical protein
VERSDIPRIGAAGWRDNALELPSAPRFPVSLTTIDKVLELIRINFFAE